MQAICWINYAFLIQDYWVVCGNLSSFFLGGLFVLETFSISPDAKKTRILLSLLFSNILFIICSLLSFIVFSDGSGNVGQTQKLPLALAGNFLLISFYMAPLSGVAHVVKARDSSSFFLPLILVQLATGICWIVYSLFIGDLLLLIPNLIATSLTIVQLACCLVFPKRTSLLSSTKGNTVKVNRIEPEEILERYEVVVETL